MNLIFICSLTSSKLCLYALQLWFLLSKNVDYKPNSLQSTEVFMNVKHLNNLILSWYSWMANTYWAFTVCYDSGGEHECLKWLYEYYIITEALKCISIVKCSSVNSTIALWNIWSEGQGLLNAGDKEIVF